MDAPVDAVPMTFTAMLEEMRAHKPVKFRTVRVSKRKLEAAVAGLPLTRALARIPLSSTEARFSCMAASYGITTPTRFNTEELCNVTSNTADYVNQLSVNMADMASDYNTMAVQNDESDSISLSASGHPCETAKTDDAVNQQSDSRDVPAEDSVSNNEAYDGDTSGILNETLDICKRAAMDAPVDAVMDAPVDAVMDAPVDAVPMTFTAMLEEMRAHKPVKLRTVRVSKRKLEAAVARLPLSSTEGRFSCMAASYGITTPTRFNTEEQLSNVTSNTADYVNQLSVNMADMASEYNTMAVQNQETDSISLSASGHPCETAKTDDAVNQQSDSRDVPAKESVSSDEAYDGDMSGILNETLDICKHKKPSPTTPVLQPVPIGKNGTAEIWPGDSGSKDALKDKTVSDAKKKLDFQTLRTRIWSEQISALKHRDSSVCTKATVLVGKLGKRRDMIACTKGRSKGITLNKGKSNDNVEHKKVLPDAEKQIKTKVQRRSSSGQGIPRNCKDIQPKETVPYKSNLLKNSKKTYKEKLNDKGSKVDLTITNTDPEKDDIRLLSSNKRKGSPSDELDSSKRESKRIKSFAALGKAQQIKALKQTKSTKSSAMSKVASLNDTVLAIKNLDTLSSLARQAKTSTAPCIPERACVLLEASNPVHAGGAWRSIVFEKKSGT